MLSFHMIENIMRTPRLMRTKVTFINIIFDMWSFQMIRHGQWRFCFESTEFTFFEDQSVKKIIKCTIIYFFNISKFRVYMDYSLAKINFNWWQKNFSISIYKFPITSFSPKRWRILNSYCYLKKHVIFCIEWTLHAELKFERKN